MTVPFPNRTRVALLSAATLFTLSHFSSATPITISASGVSSTVLAPSSDTISLNSGSGTYDSDAGPFTLQTGDFVIGNSAIPDQSIAFSFDEVVTMNGITQDVSFSGVDDVTDTADTLTIFGGPAVIFGDQTLTVAPFTISGDNIADYQVGLEASVAATPTPEPGTIFLLGTGLIGGAVFVTRRSPLAANT